LLLAAGRKPFGTTAALFGALMFMLTPAGLKLFGLARTDSVFALTVTAAALLAWRAWNRGGGWTWFWLVAALATLTKGPLGVGLAALGLLAALWEREGDTPQPVRGNHLPGLLLFFLIVGGWFGLAWLAEGQALVDKLIGRELVGHVVKNRKGGLPTTLLWQQPLFYLGRAAPWSLLAGYGVWRLWKHPAAADVERRCERFLACWFAVGLLGFSLAPHQRADLLWPLMPAAALLAGREWDRLTRRWPPERVRRGTLWGATLLVLGYGVYYHVIRLHQPVIQRTLALKAFAAEVETVFGPEPPLTFLAAPGPRQTDAPPALQVYLNLFRPPVSAERALALLRGPETAWVALDEPALLEPWRRPEDPPLFTWGQARPAGGLQTRILANRPERQLPAAFAFGHGPFDVRVRDGRLLPVVGGRLRVRALSDTSTVTVSNTLAVARPVHVELWRGERRHGGHRLLAAHSAWTVTLKD